MHRVKTVFFFQRHVLSTAVLPTHSTTILIRLGLAVAGTSWWWMYQRAVPVLFVTAHTLPRTAKIRAM